MTNEKKDNLIVLKDLQGDVDWNNKAVYNIQEDIRLILNVRVPEIKSSLVSLHSAVASVNNSVKSLEEVVRIRDDKFDKKLVEVKRDLSNLFWALIVFDVGLFLTALFMH